MLLWMLVLATDTTPWQSMAAVISGDQFLLRIGAFTQTAASLHGTDVWYDARHLAQQQITHHHDFIVDRAS